MKLLLLFLVLLFPSACTITYTLPNGGTVSSSFSGADAGRDFKAIKELQ